MTTSPLPELTGSALIRRIHDGEIAREFLIHAANGFLPFPQEDLVAVLAYLAGGDDGEISKLAKKSLAEIPATLILAVARDPGTEPEVISSLALVTEDTAVIESLLRNRSTPDEAVVRLASRADTHIQEVIVINQARILRTPAILDALLANPNISLDVKRRALEVREEFFEKKARIEEERAADAQAAQEAEDLSAIADLLEKAAAEGEEKSPQIAPSAEDLQDPEKQSVFTQILLMTVSQRVQLAFKGSKTQRTILIRDQNRLVCGAVIRNPRISESEVESIAGMRNVNDEVLRLISMRREWMSKYPIVLSLVRNPKAPIGVVLPLINRLTLRELKQLKTDKNVSEAIRTSCRKLYETRNKKN
ncbi:MAG TPA: hypothetical protein VNM92_04830 [Thermoanaerobaculia bacterium]|nr:hypothetical protein [Thermoanaerobaculia bacterium]